MQITSAQCRAARGLLNWTQDQLANNANVSRTTIVDFESNARLPIKNNLKAIADCMFAAGIELISEEGKSGVGVRFREQKLEYVKSIKVDRFNCSATMRMRYAGEDFQCVISLDAIEDNRQGNFSTDAEVRQAISGILHVVLAAAERNAPACIREGKLLVTYDMLRGN